MKVQISKHLAGASQQIQEQIAQLRVMAQVIPNKMQALAVAEKIFTDAALLDLGHDPESFDSYVIEKNGENFFMVCQEKPEAPKPEAPPVPSAHVNGALLPESAQPSN